MLLKITYPFLAIDRKNRHYLLLSERDLNKCTQDHVKYTCEQNWPIYYVQADTPCEVQIYAHTPQHTDNCERQHVLTNTTIWITLTEPRSWLYSTPSAQEISIICNNQKESKILINNTGKITLQPNCRLATPDVTLKTTNQIESKFITAHLPKYNINQISEKIVNNKYNKKQIEKLQLKHVIDNPTKLIDFSNSLSEINKELDKNENNIFQNKDFIYPVGSISFVITVCIIIAITIFIYNKCGARKNTAPPSS